MDINEKFSERRLLRLGEPRKIRAGFSHISQLSQGYGRFKDLTIHGDSGRSIRLQSAGFKEPLSA